MDRLADANRFFINGAWVSPASHNQQPIINPATERSIGTVALGNSEDVERAVAAAKGAFDAFSKWSVADRIDLLRAINDRLIARQGDIGNAVHQTMGAPLNLANGAQAGSGPQHFSEVIRVLENYAFTEEWGTTRIQREPIGVCALITPWNWPVNQVATKVAPALAAGCTMVLKPSEITPLDAVILAEILAEVFDESGVPPGVFNLVQGLGPDVGGPLCAHPDVDMISFTGSTRAGTEISKLAADGVKRVALELGGKSACILLDDVDPEKIMGEIVSGVMLNSGQSCNATTRVLIPRHLYVSAAKAAKSAAQALTVGSDGDVGPIANAAQYARVNAYIEKGIQEGATLLAGGPRATEKGFFISPTVFGDVTAGMVIANEEIFGPVITLIIYDTIEEAVSIANDSEYGLSGAVWSAERKRAVDIAKQLRTGMVHINGAGLDVAAPFGGYKKSGNGREWGVFGLEEFLEIKSIYGANG